MKRALDMTAAVAAITLTWPFLLLIGVAVRWFIGAPVFFRQERPGLRGEPFTVLKFRTMLDTKNPQGELLPDAQRLTRVGRFLRSTSLDEVPELFNVLKGDMSLVGPRPLLMEYLPLYTSEQTRRHEVRPGITGWAQVNGRNAITWEKKFMLDVWYVDNQSFWLDLKILAMTALQVLRCRGISAVGEATMPVFTGSKQPEKANVG
jgi:lipopolysaccharide/colanic/teichoic acid biosynthesis glycosyltransferase